MSRFLTRVFVVVLWFGLSSTPVWAQDGKGLIPDDGLVFWISADAGVDTDGTTVTTWTDQVGGAVGQVMHGRNGAPELQDREFPGGSRPVVRLGEGGDCAAGLNPASCEGVSCIDFGNLDVMDSQTFSAYVVLGSESGHEAQNFFANWGGPGNNGWGLGIRNDNPAGVDGWMKIPTFDDASNPDPGNNAFIGQVNFFEGMQLENLRPYYMTMTVDQAASQPATNPNKLLYRGPESGTLDAAVDNLIFRANVQSLGATENSTFTVGCLTGGNQYFFGYIAELLVYNTVDRDQQLAVEGYLSEKYFLSPSPGGQIPGNLNGDQATDGTDALILLEHLFFGEPDLLPCGNGGDSDPANKALLDFNGDGGIDMSDAIALLRWHILGGGQEHPLGSDCVEIEDCPDSCIP